MKIGMLKDWVNSLNENFYYGIGLLIGIIGVLVFVNFVFDDNYNTCVVPEKVVNYEQVIGLFVLIMVIVVLKKIMKEDKK